MKKEITRDTSELKQMFINVPELIGKELMGVKVFNANMYIETLGEDNKLTVDSFKKDNDLFIDSVCEKINITKSSMFIKDEFGDTYIHVALAVSFLEYFSVGFKMWSNSRVIELMVDGFSMSDNFIIANTLKRFGVEQLKEILK